jgi:cell division protein FtsZ
MAVSSPLLEASIDGAYGVLLSIAGGSDLGLFEINEAAALVSQAAHVEANIIFGAVIDDALGDEVRVTVIAAGFDGGLPKRRDAGQPALRRDQAQAPPQGQPQAPPAAQHQQGLPQHPGPQVPSQGPPPQQGQPAPYGQMPPGGRPLQPAQAAGQGPQQAPPQRQGPGPQQGGAPQGAPAPQAARPPRPVQFDDEDLDVPDFLK